MYFLTDNLRVPTATDDLCADDSSADDDIAADDHVGPLGDDPSNSLPVSTTDDHAGPSDSLHDGIQFQPSGQGSGKLKVTNNIVIFCHGTILFNEHITLPDLIFV